MVRESFCVVICAYQSQRATRSTYAANLGINRALERAGDGKALPPDQQVINNDILLSFLLLLLHLSLLHLLLLLLLDCGILLQAFVRSVLSGLAQMQQGSSAQDLSNKIQDLLLKVRH